MRGQGSPCIALPGHGICVGRRTTLLQLQQATQGPRSLQILSSICLLCHSFTVHGCARYTFVHVCHDNFLFGRPPKLSGLVNEAVAAGSHIVRTAPADESRPNVHRLLCRSQTGEPKTVPSLCVSTTLLRDNKASSQKTATVYSRNLLALQGNIKGMLWTFKAEGGWGHMQKRWLSHTKAWKNQLIQSLGFCELCEPCHNGFIQITLPMWCGIMNDSKIHTLPAYAGITMGIRHWV